MSDFRPRPDPFRLYRELTPLRMIRRFQQHSCVRPQSVAEHSYYVALLAGAFATKLQNREVYVDRQKVLEGALWHDAAEALTGDLPHPVTRTFPALGAAWAEVEEELLATLKSLSGCWGLPESGSLEGLLVKYADWAELVLYVYEEQLSGNRAINKPQAAILAALEGPLRDKFSAQGPKVFAWYDRSLRDLSAALAAHDPNSRLCFLSDLGFQPTSALLG
jgi:5'-deoxynucleotidase